MGGALFSLKGREYTPKWNGNRDDADPIVVEFRPLSVDEADEFAIEIRKRGKFATDLAARAAGDGEQIDDDDARAVFKAQRDLLDVALGRLTRLRKGELHTTDRKVIHETIAQDVDLMVEIALYVMQSSAVRGSEAPLSE